MASSRNEYNMIWLVTATPFEVDMSYFVNRYGSRIVCICTGVGVPSTLYRLQQQWYRAVQKPSLIVHAGIAGVYEDLYSLGTVVQIHEDTFADLGAEDSTGNWLSLNELGLDTWDTPPFVNGWLCNTHTHLAPTLGGVRAITVNTVSGTADTIGARWKRFGATLETMETAGLAYFCLSEGVPYLSVRGISNRVEPRNRDNWKMREAIGNLHTELVRLIDSLVGY
jgi:futalosine hydrolase